jgi:hypothetical protein
MQGRQRVHTSSSSKLPYCFILLADFLFISVDSINLKKILTFFKFSRKSEAILPVQSSNFAKQDEAPFQPAQFPSSSGETAQFQSIPDSQRFVHQRFPSSSSHHRFMKDK